MRLWGTFKMKSMHHHRMKVGCLMLLTFTAISGPFAVLAQTLEDDVCDWVAELANVVDRKSVV